MHIDAGPETFAHGMDADAAPTATVAIGGAFFSIKAGKHPRGDWRGGRRGAIERFSPASRRRLMTLFASIDRTACPRRPLFITLTYPNEYPTDHKVYKADLHRFFVKFARRYPRTPVVWRLEYQERGAPHYHLMAFTPVFIPWQWVAGAWYEATQKVDPLTLEAGTETRAIRSWAGVMHYASKYMSKCGSPPLGCRPGRLWGVIGRAYLPVRLQVISIDWTCFATLQQWLWAWHAGNGREVLHQYKYKGASAYLHNNLAYSMVAAASGWPGASSTSCLAPPAGY